MRALVVKVILALQFVEGHSHRSPFFLAGIFFHPALHTLGKNGHLLAPMANRRPPELAAFYKCAGPADAAHTASNEVGQDLVLSNSQGLLLNNKLWQQCVVVDMDCCAPFFFRRL
eukprot:gnl/MRDRNA2_/MRDRNA2_83152_c1_seq2.p1 gnl/MRDRNA2_/MRDRNA2_83152_c1~~gnl/MRDRNA2_/MRDRNA2_83152_c1_seq2.p1  ORF type:complete len:115 (+),score=10.79 gnl/MRDRNA2_/MRDRNA2_83152_c1_seq2:70-414(+)